jgi:hypothetical protein
VAALAVGLQTLPCHVSDDVAVGNPLTLEGGGRYGERIHCHVRIFTGRALRELAAAHGLAVKQGNRIWLLPPDRASRPCYGEPRPWARRVPRAALPSDVTSGAGHSR